MTVTGRRRVFDELPAWPESVAPLRRTAVDLARDCGASEDQLEDIAVAVSEALSNVVRHAYAGEHHVGTVAIEAWVEGRALIVVVSDEGIGIRPRERPGVGMGLRIIFLLTERLEFVDTTPGARVRMTFALG